MQLPGQLSRLFLSALALSLLASVVADSVGVQVAYTYSSYEDLVTALSAGTGSLQENAALALATALQLPATSVSSQGSYVNVTDVTTDLTVYVYLVADYDPAAVSAADIQTRLTAFYTNPSQFSDATFLQSNNVAGVRAATWTLIPSSLPPVPLAPPAAPAAATQPEMPMDLSAPATPPTASTPAAPVLDAPAPPPPPPPPPSNPPAAPIPTDMPAPVPAPATPAITVSPPAADPSPAVPPTDSTVAPPTSVTPPTSPLPNLTPSVTVTYPSPVTSDRGVTLSPPSAGGSIVTAPPAPTQGSSGSAAVASTQGSSSGGSKLSSGAIAGIAVGAFAAVAAIAGGLYLLNRRRKFTVFKAGESYNLV